MILKSQIVDINGKSLLGITVDLPNAPVLMLVGSKGFIGCGYFRTDVADKVGHAFAVVSGVRTIDEILKGNVVSVSTAASKLGVTTGMTGADAGRILA